MSGSIVIPGNNRVQWQSLTWGAGFDIRNQWVEFNGRNWIDGRRAVLPPGGETSSVQLDSVRDSVSAGLATGKCQVSSEACCLYVKGNSVPVNLTRCQGQIRVCKIDYCQ